MIDPESPDFTNTPIASGRARFGYAPAWPDVHPCLSIITPFFDSNPSVFEETAESVRRQSLQQWEWIIVNDGSTNEASLAALDAYRGSDPRIHVIDHDRNRGLPAARNSAVRHARTEFVLQLDSDDLLEQTAAEKWLWFLVSHPEYAFVKGYGVGFGAEEYLWTRGFHEGEAFLRDNLVAPTSLLRRAAIESVGGYDEQLVDGLEDWEFWLRCAGAGFWGATVPEYLDWYRRKGRERERWANWEDRRIDELLAEWRDRYPHLWEGGFPEIAAVDRAVEFERLPCENVLAKARRRLLLVVPWVTVGGSDKFNIDLVQQLSTNGWEVTVVATLPGEYGWLPRLVTHTPDVFVLPHFLQPRDFPRFFLYLIRSRRPDAVLVSNSLFAYTALPFLRAAADGIPLLDYCHIEEDWLDGGYARLSLENSGLLDLTMTASEHLRRWMIDRGAEPERVEVCYVNVGASNGSAASRADLGAAADMPVILYACRLCPQKQPRVFAKTMCTLRDRGLSFLALVVGDGPDLPWLVEYIREKGLGAHVLLLGPQPNERTRQLTAAADVVFLPSDNEGIAITLYEAMAEGVPVVGAAVGGQSELVTPDCGVLVERGPDEDSEAERYADVLADLFADPERRRTMGAAGKLRIEAQFKVERIGPRVESLVDRAVDLAARAPRSRPSPQEVRNSALEAVANWPWTLPGDRQ